MTSQDKELTPPPSNDPRNDRSDDPSNDRREQMLVAAAALISERGFAATRISDVAKRVGVSPGLVVYYFATKDQLLTAALRHDESVFFAAVEALLGTPATLIERLRMLLGYTFVDNADIPGTWGLWFDVWAQAFRHPQVSQDRRELDDQWRDLLVRIVRAGIESGEIADREAGEIREFAASWAAYLDGLTVQVALSDPHIDADRACELGLRFAARELGFDID
ncbi:MAG: TetR/AcrR family transcriptional regulator [Nocardioides sp.]